MAPGRSHLPVALLTSVTGSRDTTDDKPVSPAPQVAPRLVCQINGDAAHTVILPLDQPIVVGRTTDEPGATRVDLDLKDFRGAVYGVSRVHAMITLSGGDLFVQDLGSTNGTRLNGLRLEAHVRELVRAGDEIEFGRVHIVVRVVFGGQ